MPPDALALASVCPLCDTPVEEPREGSAPRSAAPSEYCDVCGGYLREGSYADQPLDRPPADVVVTSALPPAVPEGTSPYRATEAEASLDLSVPTMRRRLLLRGPTPVFFVAWLFLREDRTSPFSIALAVMAAALVTWALIPVPTRLRLVANARGLTVVEGEVPLHRGRSFDAAKIHGIFVRSLARADRPEDRRLELVLVEPDGEHHTLLRGLDDPRALSWIATNLERALGFEEDPA